MSRFPGTMRRAAALSLSDWLVICEVWIEIARVRVRLVIHPPSAVRAALATRVRTSSAGEIQPRFLELFRVAVSHHVGRPTCLPRAIALKHMLDRRGFAPALKIGGRREGAAFLGHAWVELDGRPIDEMPDIASNYPPLQRGETAVAVWTE